jgi:hypothetical protein
MSCYIPNMIFATSYLVDRSYPNIMNSAVSQLHSKYYHRPLIKENLFSDKKRPCAKFSSEWVGLYISSLAL